MYNKFIKNIIIFLIIYDFGWKYTEKKTEDIMKAIGRTMMNHGRGSEMIRPFNTMNPHQYKNSNYQF
jgi:hypothetical protein